MDNNGELKNQVYETLRRNAVAVFSDDILEPSRLTLCGIKLPVSGLDLFKILLELAKERKLVMWRDDGAYGFMPAKRWRKELSAISEPVRLDCETMRLKGREIKMIEKSKIGIVKNAFLIKASRTPGVSLPDKL